MWREERGSKIEGVESQQGGEVGGVAFEGVVSALPPIFDAFFPSHSTSAAALPFHFRSGLP